MEPCQLDVLAQRLVANPHDADALAYAYQAGAADPKSYALLLERVGVETRDAGYASHWLSEAASVWSATLGDAHRAARVLMQAIDRDPTHRVAADRLAQLYRDKGDVKALVALLERRAKALAPLAPQNDEIRSELAAMHEELGSLWSDSLQQPKKGLDNFRRSIDLGPPSAYAIYGAREIYKSLGQWGQAIPMYEPELAVERDPQRQLALLRDEALTRRMAGDLVGATRALDRARKIDPADRTLQQEFSALVVDRACSGEEVARVERSTAAALLVGLAEVYDGPHGFAYATGALDLEPGHERALQLYAHYAQALDQQDDLAARYLAYVEANPSGAMAADARWLLAVSYEAAGQIENAIQILEPLRDDQHHPNVAAKLAELDPQAGRTRVTRLKAALETAQKLADDGRLDEACDAYRAVLAVDTAHAEALAWVERHLLEKGDASALRPILLAAADAAATPNEARQAQLRKLADLCEHALHDLDGAIDALRRLQATGAADATVRGSLIRLSRAAARWDELARLLEEEVEAEGDLSKKVALEEELAELHDQKRGDSAAAARTLERVVQLAPGDARTITAASAMHEKAGDLNRAAEVLASSARGVASATARREIFERLARLCEQRNDASAAGDGYVTAAEITRSDPDATHDGDVGEGEGPGETSTRAQKDDGLWGAAERCFIAAGRWDRAAHASVQRAHLAGLSPSEQASHWARASQHAAHAADETSAIDYLERAIELDPASEELAQRLSDRYAAGAHWSKLAKLLERRSDVAIGEARPILRRQAAHMYANRLGDPDAARRMWLLVLDDAGADREALEWLADDAVERADHEEAAGLLRRLAAAAVDPADRTRIALREARWLAEGKRDAGAAVDAYETILADLDAACLPALQALANLQEERGDLSAAADVLERELKLVGDASERVAIARRLARMYESLDDGQNAVAALEMVRREDPDDFDVLGHLEQLYEKREHWDKAAELLAERISVEADEAEVSALTAKLAHMFAGKLDRGEDALAALSELADRGDANLRAAYIEIGDRLGWHGMVATKLVEWWLEAAPGSERTASLRSAFERFTAADRDRDATRVACEIVRSKGADRDLVTRLETLAVKTGDLDALSMAQELLARELTGLDRALELARQAESMVAAGAPRIEALQHGELGLASVPPGEAEAVLARLAAIADQPDQVVDLYERQIARCKTPGDRLRALARAAQAAATGAPAGPSPRARAFLEAALGDAPPEQTIAMLEKSAREADAQTGRDGVRRALCSAMAAGGAGARDGGRTRASLLRHAASMVYRDLGDVDQALAWLGESLVACVDPLTLDELESFASELGAPQRAESTLSRALDEVSDVPLVRQLLARRAKLRREQLGDKGGAAADLKKLRDLSPHDQATLDELSALLTELGDYRGMVHLYEDQIVRGKDVAIRAELARTVARMWEGQLGDPREAADAWRRVLRMKAGDAEATAGLERAKANMLRSESEGGVEDGRPHDEVSGAGSSEDNSACTRPENHPSQGATEESIGVDATACPGVPRAGEGSSQDEAKAASDEADDQVLVADDLAEMIDMDEPGGSAREPMSDGGGSALEAQGVPPEAAGERRRRSVPPPIPRG